MKNILQKVMPILFVALFAVLTMSAYACPGCGGNDDFEDTFFTSSWRGNFSQEVRVKFIEHEEIGLFLVVTNFGITELIIHFNRSKVVNLFAISESFRYNLVITYYFSSKRNSNYWRWGDRYCDSFSVNYHSQGINLVIENRALIEDITRVQFVTTYLTNWKGVPMSYDDEWSERRRWVLTIDSNEDIESIKMFKRRVWESGGIM